MTSDPGTESLFELHLPLPDPEITRRTQQLIGFTQRYGRVGRDIRLLVDHAELEAWSTRNYGKVIPLIDVIRDRHPLAIFYGDVGTGKTVTAEGTANQLAIDLQKESRLFKLSTRVRGTGRVGEMSVLLNKAIDTVITEAGQTRLAFLIIDEADSLASARSDGESHHEDKVGVNTLIQRLDDIRRTHGRVMVFLCTNRFRALDQAVVRRAGRLELFERPTLDERIELLTLDLGGTGLDQTAVRTIAERTGAAEGRAAYTFSDFRNRLYPAALARAYPDRVPTIEDFIEALSGTDPSPVLVT